MSNLTEPQSILAEIAVRTSGDLTSVEVISYVEALSRSAWRLESKEFAARPGTVNATLAVSSVLHHFVGYAWKRFVTPCLLILHIAIEVNGIQ